MNSDTLTELKEEKEYWVKSYKYLWQLFQDNDRHRDYEASLKCEKVIESLDGEIEYLENIAKLKKE